MSRRLTTEQFISKAIVKHKIVFDYSKTIYIKANEPVIISCYQHGEFKQTPYNHLNSKLGCPKCSYKNTGEILKVSQNELIKRFVDKHGDKYDYVNCKYNHMHDKIEIICKIHGSFLQNPWNHIKGSGCPKCAFSGRSNPSDKKTGIFIDKSIKLYGNKYDYSKVTYCNDRTKICIICIEHGEFWQTPRSHFQNNGCKGCTTRRINTEEFIKRAKAVHSDKFLYDNVNYVLDHVKVDIICKKHGSFWLNPNKHLQGGGCGKCAGRDLYNTETFIEKAMQVHNNKYNYSKTEYTGADYKICIICPYHNEFWQTAYVHLNGSGCKNCMTLVSKSEKLWLDDLNISNSYRQKYVKVSGFRAIRVDALTPDKKIFEFYGDFWHGNPKIYPADLKHPIKNATYGELYQLTIKREQAYRDAGYTVVSIWESDWKAQQKAKKDKL